MLQERRGSSVPERRSIVQTVLSYNYATQIQKADFICRLLWLLHMRKSVLVGLPGTEASCSTESSLKNGSSLGAA